MKRPLLQQPAKQITLGFQRRATLKAAAAWLVLGGLPAAMAQQRGNLVELLGDVQLNGQRLLPDQTVQTGDHLQTGPASGVMFVIGDSAFRVHPNSRLSLDRGNSLTHVSQLRLHAGAVSSVWGTRHRSQIITPGMSADFRGAGVYAEVFEKQEQHNYLCNCYGTLRLFSGKEKTVSTSTYHQAYWAAPDRSQEDTWMPADSINHTDEELELLAQLINQKTAWQVSGEKAQAAPD